MKITGLSIQDILDMGWNEIKKLNDQELRQLSMRLNSAANKRLRRIEKSGEQKWSPAYKAITESGGDFTVKGKDRTEILAEIQRAGSFIGSKTSTVKGTKMHKKVINDLLKEDKPKMTKDNALKKAVKDVKSEPEPEITEKQRKTLFAALDLLRQKNGSMVYNIGSPTIIKEIRKAQLEKKSRNRFHLVKAIENKFPELLETSEERYVREQSEINSRTDEDGVFHPISSDLSLENPFTNR